MISHWDLANVLIPPDAWYVIKNFIIMLPFIAMSIEFFVALGPVVIYFRSKTDNKVVAHYRAMRVYNRAYLFLVGLVVFYTISFNLAIDHDQAVVAYTANISALALAAQNMDGALIKVLNLILKHLCSGHGFLCHVPQLPRCLYGDRFESVEPVHECRCHSEKRRLPMLPACAASSSAGASSSSMFPS